MSGLRWLEGPFGREAVNPWTGQATGVGVYLAQPGRFGRV